MQVAIPHTGAAVRPKKMVQPTTAKRAAAESIRGTGLAVGAIQPLGLLFIIGGEKPEAYRAKAAPQEARYKNWSYQ